MPRGRGNID